jgi:hypothetical protein
MFFYKIICSSYGVILTQSPFIGDSASAAISQVKELPIYEETRTARSYYEDLHMVASSRGAYRLDLHRCFRSSADNGGRWRQTLARSLR